MELTEINGSGQCAMIGLCVDSNEFSALIRAGNLFKI
jgi:hypothetical protein